MSPFSFSRALSLCALFFIAFVGMSERAYGVDTYVLPEDKDRSVDISTKLSRGIVNVASSPLEIPKKAYIESSRSDQWIETPARLLSGAIIGVGRGVIRAGAGVFDVLTFPFDINGYEPILEPEYVF